VSDGEAAVFLCLNRQLIETDMQGLLCDIFECNGSYGLAMSQEDWEYQEGFSLQLVNLIHAARGVELEQYTGLDSDDEPVRSTG
jgi:hypothetical protein